MVQRPNKAFSSITDVLTISGRSKSNAYQSQILKFHIGLLNGQFQTFCGILSYLGSASYVVRGCL